MMQELFVVNNAMFYLITTKCYTEKLDSKTHFPTGFLFMRLWFRINFFEKKYCK